MEERRKVEESKCKRGGGGLSEESQLGGSAGFIHPPGEGVD